MEKIGIIKELESLCRLVIPKEFRERYGITKEVELVATKDGILIRNPEYKLIKIEKQ